MDGRLRSCLLVTIRVIRPMHPSGLFPDNLLLRAVRKCAELGIRLEDDFQAMSEHRFLAPELERLRTALNLPPMVDAIREFLANELEPFLKDSADISALESEREYLQLCREALLLRQRRPFVFINPVDWEGRETTSRFYRSAFRKGFLLFGQNGGALGDRNTLQRIISENFIRQMMWTRRPVCPMVREKMNCGDHEPICDGSIARLFPALKASKKLCPFVNMFGRYQLIDFKLESDEHET